MTKSRFDTTSTKQNWLIQKSKILTWNQKNIVQARKCDNRNYFQKCNEDFRDRIFFFLWNKNKDTTIWNVMCITFGISIDM